MANALTISRIALSVALLALSALSPGFLVVYVLADATDMLDGFFITLNKADKEGILAHHDVQRLLHKRGAIPLAEPEHDQRRLPRRPTLHPPRQM